MFIFSIAIFEVFYAYICCGLAKIDSFLKNEIVYAQL